MEEQLTPREQEIFDLLLEGVSPKEIAYKLHITNRTFDFHRTNVYRKLGVQSIRELLVQYSNTGNGAASAAIAVTEPPARQRLRLMLLISAAVLVIAILFREKKKYITRVTMWGSDDRNRDIISIQNPQAKIT